MNKEEIDTVDSKTMNRIKIAYILLVHSCPEQVNRFVNQILEYGDSEVYLHVDTKNIALKEEIIASPRVHIYSVYSVNWGSFEIVKAAYYLINKVVESGEDYSHIYFGSGQDLLVKKGLYDYLDAHRNTTFIKIHGEVTSKDRQSARYRIKWPKNLMVRNDWSVKRYIRIALQLLCSIGVVVRPNKHRLNDNIRFYHGRTWFVAPIEVAEYINNYILENPDYVSFWEDSLASDLMFFQTIIMNSPFKNLVEDELMYVNFGKSFGTMNHPIDISIKDDRVISNGKYFFARKFNYNDKNTYNYFFKKALE